MPDQAAAPLTPEALQRLTEDEQVSFVRALQYVAEDSYPPIALVADLVLMVQRLITGDRAESAEAKLATAIVALRRLSLIDEMAGMGQRDDDPELKARCRFAARALEQITEGAGSGELVAEGDGPLLDPDCRDGKHTSCMGPPCECPVPGVHSARHEHERSQTS